MYYLNLTFKLRSFLCKSRMHILTFMIISINIAIDPIVIDRFSSATGCITVNTAKTKLANDTMIKKTKVLRFDLAVEI